MEDSLKINKDIFYDTGKRPGIDAVHQTVEVEASQPDIIRGLNFILMEAVRLKASDIHIEPLANYYKIRFRIDGLLKEIPSITIQLGNGLISRVKVLARLNISAKGLPQDGRFSVNVDQRTIELRVSIIPMFFGEGMAMRILDKSSVKLDLANLGLDESSLQIIRDSTKKHGGIIFVTGPTGSGKTTTLYAILNELNQEYTRIVTVEDPVEYEINGIMQVEVRPDIGLTFASSLRSILRQDPNIILIGEIRDTETAKVAIEASLTGHLILSTIHTRDTVSTVSRLVDMGVEPYLLADTIDLIIAQRLVRTICNDCKEPYQARDGESYMIGTKTDGLISTCRLEYAKWSRHTGFSHDDQPTSCNLPSTVAALSPGGGRDIGHSQPILYRGTGCYKCNFTGYRGRTGIFEIMNISDEERGLIIDMDFIDSLYKHVRNKGMLSLREDGIKKAFDGITTYEEVMRNI